MGIRLEDWDAATEHLGRFSPGASWKKKKKTLAGKHLLSKEERRQMALFSAHFLNVELGLSLNLRSAILNGTFQCLSFER